MNVILDSKELKEAIIEWCERRGLAVSTSTVVKVSFTTGTHGARVYTAEVEGIQPSGNGPYR